jgi:hypothetical protein
VDPISIGMLALGMIQLALKTAKELGLLGNPEGMKYVDAGLSIAAKALPIIQESRTNPAKYDTMTPAEIRGLLTPASWDEIEARAKAELGLEA